MERNLIGIDIGATNTRLAVISETGKIVAIKRFPSEMAAGLPFFQTVAAKAAELGKDYQAIAVGVGSAGQIDKKTGSYLPGLYPDAAWVGVPLRDLVQAATKLPTFVDNDCKISAYGELKVGLGQGVSDFITLTLGTGIGGGIIAGGELIHGAQGVAGHVGHITINPAGPICPCGTQGCLELYVSGTAIAKRGGKALGKPVTSPQVFQLAVNGNEQAQKILHETAAALGQGLGSLANALNPELFILGGSILEWWPVLEPTVKASFRQYVMTQLQDTPILPSQLKGDGGIIGAALFAFDQLTSV